MASCDPPPYEAPPSYESVIAGLCYVQKTPTSQLSVVDFLAEDQNTRFSTLIERANQWLQQNNTWEAKTCESVEFKSKGGIPSVQCVTFTEHNTRTVYVRGLRLWLVPRRDPALPPQRLAYFDMVPKTLDSVFNLKFERFDDVLQQLNNRLSTNPINGSIITVETQPMKYSTSNRAVDPDRTYFTDFGFSVFVIRVFYEVGHPACESIGAIDFLPSIHERPYDTIPNLVNMAFHWSRGQPNIKIRNVQSIGIKRKFGYPNLVDNTKMSICEVRKDHTTHYYRILRLFYVVTPETAISYLSPFQGPLTCKTFLPVQLTSGNFFSLPLFETTQQTLTRISTWVQQYNVRVISSETCVVRMYTGAAKYGPDSTYYYNKAEQSERFINIVRLYLDGMYPDPHISMSTISYCGWGSNPVTDVSQIPPQEECVIL